MRFLLSFREANVGGAVVPGQLAYLDRGGSPARAEVDLAILARSMPVVLAMHGYNVSREEGEHALAGLFDALPETDDAALLGVLWPGDHWLGAFSYPFEGDDADDTAAELVAFLERTLDRGARLSFVAHSLGARVAMRTITELSERGRIVRNDDGSEVPDGRFAVEQICLMAAAIDNDSLADRDRRAYLAGTRASGRVAVLSSRSDRVLGLAYPAGDLLQGFFFSASDEFGFPLGLTGSRFGVHTDRSVRDQVLDSRIEPGLGVDHGHYLPSKDTKSRTKRARHQKAAAEYAARVLTGRPSPRYPLPRTGRSDAGR